MPHKISEKELVEKLKFVAKGEPKGKPTFRIPILEAMMSREIKESIVYLNYLAKYLNAQSGAPTLGKGRGKGYMKKGGLEVNAPKKKRADVPRRKLLEKEVNKEVDKTYNAQLKVKLKAPQQISHAAHSLLDLKKGVKESKKQRILEEIVKALREGLGVAPNSPDHSDSTNNSIWESTNDDKTESDKDSDHGDESDNSDKGDDNDDSDKEYDARED
ncbi:hypothetical protein Tco_0809524 [Tanacetum coccineum]